MVCSDLTWHVLPKPQRMWLTDTEIYPIVIAFAFDQNDFYWLTSNGVQLGRENLVHTPEVDPT